MDLNDWGGGSEDNEKLFELSTLFENSREYILIERFIFDDNNPCLSP